MSPAENKRAKRRKNKKGRTGLKNSDGTEETHPNFSNSSEGSTQDCKMIEEIQEVLDRELVQSLPVTASGQCCLLCHCEKTEDDVQEDERGIGDGCQDDDDDDDDKEQLPLWVCQECKRSVEVEQQRGGFDPNRADYMLPPNRDLLAFVAESVDSVNGEHSPCHCEACRERRVLEAEQVQEQQELRNFWQELKQAVHQMYRDAGLPLGEASQQLLPPAINRLLPDTEHLKYMVQRLCRHDPHKLYQCLEAQVKLFIVEMRLRLLRHLVSGQPNKSFVCAMLEEYAKLCSASCKIAPIVEELETNHLKSFNLTWELVNRHLFQSIVYADSVLNARVIEVFTQQRLSGNREKGRQDPYSAITKFNDEMTVISVVWIEAQQLIEEYNQGQAAVRVKKRLLRKDWERFKAQWKLVEEEILSKPSSYFPRCTCEECQSSHVHNSSHMTSGLLTPTELVSLAEQADGTGNFSHAMVHRGCSKSSGKGTSSASWPTCLGHMDCPQNAVASLKEDMHTKSQGLYGASPDCPMMGAKSEQCHSSPCSRHNGCFCDSVNGELISCASSGDEEGPPKHHHRDDKGEDADRANLLSQIPHDAKPCECHSCVQQQQELFLSNGSPHTANAFPLLPHLGEVSRGGGPHAAAKPLIHPHLYNVHVRKNGKQQAHHLPWSVNLELETQEVLQEQINLATYGDWDSDFDDTSRSILAHHKHGGNFLGSGGGAYNLPHNSFLLSPNSSRSRSGSASDGSTCSGLHNMATQANIPDAPLHSLFRGGGGGAQSAAPPSSCSNAGTGPIRSSANCHSELDLSPGKASSAHNNGLPKDQKVLTDGFGSLPLPECPLVNGRHLQNNQSLCCDAHIPEGEESIDDSCSEQSSSTSTSNQRESRVCDCCYCEVFGHGVPVVAPVSRNYPEMRDRLRLRLSKRKAEGVSTTGKPQPEKNEQVVDNRALEELLKYINGTEENKLSGTKAAKKQRKKLKKVEERLGKDLHAESESTCFSEMEDYRDVYCHENHCRHNERAESPVMPMQKNPFPECSNRTSSPKTKHYDKPSRHESPPTTCTSQKNLRVATNNPPNPPGKVDTRINVVTSNKHAAAEVKTAPLLHSSPKKIVNGIVKENVKGKSKEVTTKHCLSPVMSRHSLYNPETDSSSVLTPLKKEVSRSAENLHVTSQNQINSALTKEPTLQQAAKPTIRTKKNKKKKNCVDDITSPDDVFMPKDIDLENGELDEFEKELEAFKRFCFNSKPLAKKEKVHVNMKDLVIKRRPAFSANIPPAQKL